jgi:N-acetylglucosamine transport system substrate-binding protein
MKRVLFFCFLVAISATMVFAGGRQSQSGTASTALPTLEIAAFEGGYGRAYWDDIVAQFQAAHPEAKVNLTIDPEIYTITSARIAAGEWPDFSYDAFIPRTGGGSVVVENHELLDITDVFEDDVPDRPGTKLKDYVLTGTLESAVCAPYGDGRIYQAPFNASPTGLVYNKALFTSKGWKVPSTWDEFFALAKELDKSENYATINGQQVKRTLFTYQGIYPSYNEVFMWSSIASAGGQSVLKRIFAYEPGSFSVPAVRQVVTNMANIGSGGHLMQGSIGLNHTQAQADFLLGKALFHPNGTWVVNEMADAPREPGFTFGMTSSLLLQAGQTKYITSSMERFNIPKAAKNIPLAKEFLKFLYTRKSVESFAKNAGGVYAVKDATELGKPYLLADVYNMNTLFSDGTFFLVDFATLPANTKVSASDAIWNNMGLLMGGNITVDEYIRLVEAAFTEITQDKARAN